ncbi:uncharacterized protein LOC143252914 isoform X2 [Tachypleus tridentatus]|uniref:uncharacterized protein LOC143252914 isoform X2 n=1 Tax=Tachypleus tridentatus TaxID=6853 RepID=UPI003FD280F6
MEFDTSPDTPVNLVPCSVCGRTFNSDTLERHQKICQKLKTKKRKVFDSSKMRIKGTEVPAAQVKKQSKEVKKKTKSNWREKHEELIQAIRAARKPDKEEENESLDSSKPNKVPAGYVECPSCGRYFNERAADRHIPWCQEQKARIPKSPASIDAKERLKARTKYKAPSPGQKSGGPPASRKQPVEETIKEGPLTSPPAVMGKEMNVKHKEKHQSNKKTEKDQKKGTNKKDNKPPQVMKFKEKFPNRATTKYAQNAEKEDGYDPYQQAALQLQDLHKTNTVANKGPRTVPGKRTGGLDMSGYWATNRLVSNPEADLALIQMRLANLGNSIRLPNGFPTDFNTSWTKQVPHGGEITGLPMVSSSEVTSPSSVGPASDGETRVSTSSGSDSSLTGFTRTQNSELSVTTRFCHQCGTRYPVSSAKYCCECGARRLGLGVPFLSSA